MMYKIKFIVLLAMCLGFSSRLYGMQHYDVNMDQKIDEDEDMDIDMDIWTCPSCSYIHISSPNSFISPLTLYCEHCSEMRPLSYQDTEVAPTGHDWQCQAIETCQALITVINCLQYWQKLDKTNALKDIFNDLSSANKYKDIISAYHHLLDRHLSRQDNTKAYRYISEKCSKALDCNFKTCKRYTRNQRDRQKVDKDNEQEYIFLRDLLDTMHTYLVHASDSGHRYVPGKDMQNQANADNSDGLVDYQIKTLKKWHNSIDEQAKGLKRSGKFQTQINQIKKPLADRKVSLQALEAKFGNNKSFNTWMSYMKANECDTDCLLEQIATHNDAAECVMLMDSTLFNNIKTYIQQQIDTQTTGAYGFGVRLYYWDYYKNSQTKDYWHSAYKHKELYVAPVYLSLKCEILAKGIDISQWKQKMFEADILLRQSTTLQKIKAVRGAFGLCEKYNLKADSPLSAAHIVSMLFYTSFTGLSTAFSHSFRYLSPVEKVKAIVTRNAQWHFLSKYLREVVELFGTQIGGNPVENASVDQGSFFHGLSYVLFGELSMHFAGPLSTSKRLEVALRFTDKQGLILELQAGTGYRDKCVRFFNVSLVSCFAVEEERLFMGGQYPLRIATIRCLKDNHTTAPFMHALLVLDHMIQGIYLEDKVRQSDVSIVRKLLLSAQDFPVYIKKIWDAFRNKQQSITINMLYIYAHYKAFIPLLFDLKCKNVLLLDSIVQLLPNVNRVVCQHSDVDVDTGEASLSIVSSSFIAGLRERLGRTDQHTKLKEIMLVTSKYAIADDCDLSATQFGTLGWRIGKGAKRIVLTKKSYTVICNDAIAKISAMINGEYPPYETTFLDVPVFKQLIAGAKDIPSDVQQRWNELRRKQTRVKINMEAIYDNYSLFLPLLFSSDPRCKNLLLLDKIIRIFPNITEIVCTEVDYSGEWDKATESYYSSSIVRPSFIEGLKAMLGKVAQSQSNSLKKIMISTLEYEITGNFAGYIHAFDTFGWHIQKAKDRASAQRSSLYNKYATIVLTKK